MEKGEEEGGREREERERGERRKGQKSIALYNLSMYHIYLAQRVTCEHHFIFPMKDAACTIIARKRCDKGRTSLDAGRA